VPDRPARDRKDTPGGRDSAAVILAKGARGLFYDVRDLLRVIRSTYNPLVERRRWTCSAL